MKKSEFIFFLIILCSVSAKAQIKTEQNGFIKLSGNKYFRINDTLYAGEFEITNREYNIFLDDLEDGEYEKCRIDSSVWQRTNDLKNYEIQKRYNSVQAFDFYPVVNLSFYGAIKYCEWLTHKYKRRLRKKVTVFKLPTDNEWILISDFNENTKLPKDILEGKDSEGNYLENSRIQNGGILNDTIDGGYYTVRVDKYKPSKFGLYNIIGNVAEMTNIDGIQKGGSWDDDLKDCLVNKNQTYLAPDPRVGFRVIAIQHSKKNQRNKLHQHSTKNKS